jgi:hypothetical protein
MATMAPVEAATITGLVYGFLTGGMIFLKAAKMESRFCRGISWPIKLFRFGSGRRGPPSLSQSVCDGSSVSSVMS